jgi:hypothetical protein
MRLDCFSSGARQTSMCCRPDEAKSVWFCKADGKEGRAHSTFFELRQTLSLVAHADHLRLYRLFTDAVHKGAVTPFEQ